MTFDEAMSHVRQGRSVHRRNCLDVLYLQRSTMVFWSDGIQHRYSKSLCVNRSGRDTPYAVSDQELNATDWELTAPSIS